MENDVPKERWKIDVNDRYQNVVGTILGLATGSLVLPIFFLKLSIPEKEPLLKYLNCKAYGSWILLGLSILLAVSYYYLSAKWIKLAWGQPLKYGWMNARLEGALDWFFWLMVLFFLAGLACFIMFAIGVVPSA